MTIMLTCVAFYLAIGITLSVGMTIVERHVYGVWPPWWPVVCCALVWPVLVLALVLSKSGRL